MNRGPLSAAGVLLGMGLGGFVDGIVFHQLLQTHSMLSARLPQDVLVNVKVSMVWDGLFHAFTWLATAAGVALLWHAGTIKDGIWSGKVLTGTSVLGWGIFNLIEGIIDHYLLGIHHAVESYGLSIYDHLYLLSGVIFMIAGYFIARSYRVPALYNSKPTPARNGLTK